MSRVDGIAHLQCKLLTRLRCVSSLLRIKIGAPVTLVLGEEDGVVLAPVFLFLLRVSVLVLDVYTNGFESGRDCLWFFGLVSQFALIPSCLLTAWILVREILGFGVSFGCAAGGCAGVIESSRATSFLSRSGPGLPNAIERDIPILHGGGPSSRPSHNVLARLLWIVVVSSGSSFVYLT